MPSLATFFKAHCEPCGEVMVHNSLGCTHCGASRQAAPLAPDIVALTFGAQSARAAERRKERNKVAVVRANVQRHGSLRHEAEVLRLLDSGYSTFNAVAQQLQLTDVGVRAIVIRLCRKLDVPYVARSYTPLVQRARECGVLA